MYRYILLILISRWLLNLFCSMTEALNGQNLPSLPLNATWETLLQLLLVFLFTPSLLHFKLYKFLLTLLQL